MISLFQRRVYDIAGITSKEVKVKYNDNLIRINDDFQQYMNMYLNEEQMKNKVFEVVNDRWSYGVVLSNEYKHVSFGKWYLYFKRRKTCRLCCKSNYRKHDCVY